MGEHEEFSDIVDECMKLFDENIAVLGEIESLAEDEIEDIVKTGLTKNDLHDMAYEVADLARIRKAESDFLKRHFERPSD